HRPLLAGLDEPGQHLLAIEGLAPAVLLHDQVRDLVDALVGREALAAAQALAPAADDLALLALPRVHHLVLHVGAEGALHRAASWPAMAPATPAAATRAAWPPPGGLCSVIS